MGNTMRTVGKVCFFGFAMVAPALAQNWLQSAPSPAVAGPGFDVSLGYSQLAMPIPSARHANLNGVDLSGNIGLSPHWGAIFDSGYLHTPDVLGTGHQAYIVNLQTGPVFYLVSYGNTRVFLRTLVGEGLIDGAVPKTEHRYFYGWLLRPSYSVGGGIEHFWGPMGARINADYLHTTFYDSAGAPQGQNNLRLTMSLVFRLKGSHRGRTELR